jgi:protein-S-isoprenylcysteine O-methyltransferase Ste14
MKGEMPIKYLRAIGYTISTIGLYLGVSLLGWGLNDLADFFAYGPRLGYALVVVIFGLAIGFQAIDAPEGIRGNPGEKERVVRRQRILMIILIPLLYSTLFFLPYAAQHFIGIIHIPQGWAWFGFVLCATGFALVFWSGLTLGRMYSKDVTIQKDHKLVTTGIYQYIRHPRYLGVILISLGLGLVHHSWIGIAAIVLVFVLFYIRIKDEEAVMSQQFGEAWDNYCKRSWRLIPYVY